MNELKYKIRNSLIKFLLPNQDNEDILDWYLEPLVRREVRRYLEEVFAESKQGIINEAILLAVNNSVEGNFELLQADKRTIESLWDEVRTQGALIDSINRKLHD